jgi:hypothetical protein
MDGIILVQNPSSLKKYELDIREKILKGQEISVKRKVRLNAAVWVVAESTDLYEKLHGLQN